jgi:5-methyltetrahydrofolate--homocysteine methyltransferase
MANMAAINQTIKKSFPEVITFVGGAPLNHEFAQKIGADYYTSGPQEMVDILDQLTINNAS